MNKLRILLRALKGELKKIIIKLKFKLNLLGIHPIASDKSDIIISLTSYGRRVKKSLPYTLYSLVKQTMKADKIIVWLDNDNWDDTKLNSKLRKLKGLGVEFRYCDDIKSYKKLIPALNEFPDSKIITADDDLYYPNDFVEKLVNAHNKNPEYVHAYMVHSMSFDESGNLKPYNEWEHYIKKNDSSVNFSASGGGCVYTKTLLYKDIDRRDLFMSLSPFADDIWFFFMTFLKNTKVSVVQSSSPIIPLDAFYQKFHKQTNLKSINCDENQNDKQIKAVMEYYSVTNSMLNNYSTPSLI